MRSIYLHAEVPTGDTDLVFEHIIDFMNYPTVSPDVRSVTTHSAPAAGQARHTDWEVNFRRGIMRWTEREDIDHERWNVTFQQIDGDFDDFRGSWQLTPSPSGCRVELRVTYDFGIESLAKIMDPLAERVSQRSRRRRRADRSWRTAERLRNSYLDGGHRWTRRIVLNPAPPTD
jgi:ribosome-associated toxin RatA of RatAB toxin-antitoxin module